jgi:hypothetical protein
MPGSIKSFNRGTLAATVTMLRTRVAQDLPHAFVRVLSIYRKINCAGNPARTWIRF